MLRYIFITVLCVVVMVNSLSAQNQHSKYINYNLADLYGFGKGNGKVIYLGESPMNEATVQVFPDGTIAVYYAPDRYSQKVMCIKSTDGGFIWSEPKVIFEDSLIWQYPRRTLIDQKGNIHLLVFKKPKNDVCHTVSTDNCKTWEPLQKIADGPIGAIRGLIQTKSGRLIFAFHRRVRERTPPTGACFTSCVYSDNLGKTWKESDSKIVAPVRENYNGNNYGAVEPNIVQLNDGRIWMLFRTQTGWQYQSYSEDDGKIWSEGEPSIFHSSNSPADILKLPDGRIVVTWCNTNDTKLETFGRIYTNRDILHMAISDDDGKTWKGFREVFRIPSRNDQNDMPTGDSGVSYPNTAFTKDGKIFLVTGQGEHGGGRAMFRISPEWLYKTSQEDDFSNGLEKWSCYTFSKLGLKPGRMLGPELLSDETAKGGTVLHVRKANKEYPGDGAIWNFPMGKSGELTMRVKIPKGSAGTAISLTDHYRHPNDLDGEETAMISFNSQIFENDIWQTVSLKWSLEAGNCDLYVDGKMNSTLKLKNKTRSGISYIRFRSLAKENMVDNYGMWIDWVKVLVNKTNY